MDIIASCGKCKKIVRSSVMFAIMVPKKSLSGKDIGVATLQYVYSLFMQSKQKAFGKQ